jgi:hypothetical protein
LSKSVPILPKHWIDVKEDFNVEIPLKIVDLRSGDEETSKIGHLVVKNQDLHKEEEMANKLCIKIQRGPVEI